MSRFGSSSGLVGSGQVSLQHLNEFGESGRESGHGYGGVLVNKMSKQVSARVWKQGRVGSS